MSPEVFALLRGLKRTYGWDRRHWEDYYHNPIRGWKEYTRNLGGIT